MAIVKAPLMSFGASGAIAHALVYFPWKGLDCVRSYVTPANPKSAKQTTQRGYLKAVVAAIHAIQTLGVNGFLAIDYAAYSLWGSIFPSPRTWFNQVCKNALDQNVALKKRAIYHKMVVTPAPNQLGLACVFTKEGVNAVTAGSFHWGTSKSALINTEAAAIADSAITATIAGLATKTKYFFQFRSTAHDDFDGTMSGIYMAYTT